MAINRDKVNAAAIKLLQAGKYDKAIAELRKLVEDDPSDVRTILKIGDTYVKMGSRGEAIQSYERVAQIYSEQGFYLKAVAVFKQMLRVDGQLPDVHLKLAELYQQLGLTSDCLQHYQQVAIFYEQSGRAKDSLAILKRMVDLDPDNLPSRIKLAELFAQQGQMQDAVGEFKSAAAYLLTQQREDDFIRVGERLIFFDPGALDMTRQLAEIYLKRGDAKLALGKLQLCFKTDPRNLETLSLIAKAFLDMQQVPKTVSVYKEMARIHESNGAMGEARTQWQRVLDLTPGDEDAEIALGMRGGAAGAPAPAGLQGGLPGGVPAPAAVAAAPTSAASEDETIQRMLTETDVYVKYGLKDKAAEHIQKILSIRPDHLVALEKLKGLYQKMGERLRLRMTLEKLVPAAIAQGDPRAADWQNELSALGGPTGGGGGGGGGRAAPRSAEGEIILVDEDAALAEAVDAIAANAPAEEDAFDPEAADLPLDEPMLDEEIAVESGEILVDAPADVAVEEEAVLPADEAFDPSAAAGFDDGDMLIPDEPPEAPAPAPAPMQFAPPPVAAAKPVFDDIGDGADLSAALAARRGADDFGGGTFPGDADAFGDLGEGTLPPYGNGEGPSQLPSATADAILDEYDSFDEGGAPPGPRTTATPSQFSHLQGTEHQAFTDMEAPSIPDAAPVSEIGAEVEAALAAEEADDFIGSTVVNPHGGDMADELRAAIARGSPATMEDPSRLPPEFSRDGGQDLDDPTMSHGAPVQPATDPNRFEESSPPTASHDGAFEDDAPQMSAEEEQQLKTAGKLGFAGKAQGFENDPANTFFPDELEEAEFFISQGLLDEAKEIVQSILEDVPESARAQHMLARVEALEQGLPEPPAPWEQKILDEVAAELDNLGGEEPAQAAAEPVDPASMQVSVEEVLSQFKKGVAETVAEDDAATHYDLGIAYREMGLLDDAISEFNLASRAPAKTADARYLVGLTFMDKGDFQEALGAFESAMAAPNVKNEQRAASEYQRGVCFATLSQGKDALRAFKRAKQLGTTATDVDRRVQKLVEELGGDVEDDPAFSTPDPKSGRPKNIDYV